MPELVRARVLRPFRFGGNAYGPGFVLRLSRDAAEAAGPRMLEIIEAKLAPAPENKLGRRPENKGREAHGR